MNGRRATLFFTISNFVKLFMRIQSDKNHAMFVHASLQIDLVLNKLIMALAEKLTHENAEASISQGVIVSMH
ncbi:hypothetical protein KUC3_05020 [Alteromonas sp. KC3]|nr:hypothetical protein KUC3_05020 [Alteromonas sp. KC3]